MRRGQATELILIRHAPAITGGRLCGRTDVPADLGDTKGITSLCQAIGTPDHFLVSPALRCRQTLAALWPEAGATQDEALWEQDFGGWDGLPYSDLPDIGALSGAALAAHRPPAGESFEDLCQRAAPALERAASLAGRVAVVAHAGIVRAGLAHALSSPSTALAFEVAPLSVTRLRPLAGGGFSIISVNWTAA
ncbi:histidine phosphatase family protein [Defluviimonas sp. WL0002]|uniref:Histidine phosphatase family protein n=1 Tax=Albidovulum marisflavi TaxID=2984159 RepID=A0ABT2Z9E7_9RHOB|nr:histidine phosphatase family protein [Defluviimonas sp. WL0002]MCV2867759.1 histidine phosphatase family protein [Defluviimonas sp. WL0002]